MDGLLQNTVEGDKIATALGLNNELEHLFEDVPPLSIEEIIRGQD